MRAVLIVNQKSRGPEKVENPLSITIKDYVGSAVDPTANPPIIRTPTFTLNSHIDRTGRSGLW